MAGIRKLPSGLWQASVRLPSGKRTTRTDPLKRVVSDWAKDLESSLARGEWRDPRQARLHWTEWRDRWLAARVVEPETARSDRSTFKHHLNPQWEGWRLGAITRIEVQAWVKRMVAAGHGPTTVRRSVVTMTTMMNAAVDEGLVSENPCRRLKLPTIPRRTPEWFTPEQLDLIVAELPAQHSAAAQLMSWSGLRWGECAGLQIGEVMWLRRRVRVERTRDQYGRAKDYPKSDASRREVPVPPHVLDLLAPIAGGRDADELLFRTERPFRGELRPWSGANWRVRWNDAIAAAQAREEAAAAGEGRKPVPVPDYSPHALRHTAASWLVQSGVPLYDVQALLGHGSFQVTQKYAHLAPDSHGAIEDAWTRRREAHHRRTDVDDGRDFPG